jgi:hypothetical protein
MEKKYYLFCLQRWQPYGWWEDLESYTLEQIFEILYDYHSIDNNVEWFTLWDLLDFEWWLFLDKDWEQEVDYSTINLNHIA